ncbi:hypothetical protein D3C87_1992030 [compost metagenome]
MQHRQFVEATALVRVRRLDIEFRIDTNAAVLIVDDHFQPAEHVLDPDVVGCHSFHK